MAGFGAGFGKALGGSLEAAGKLYQEEQLRSREYERAKADRQAEILDTRTYNERIAAEERERAAEEKTHRYSKGSDGKFYYTTLEGTLVEKDPNSPGVRLYLQDEEKRGQDRIMFGLDVEGKKVGIRRDEAAIRTSNAAAAAYGRKGDDSAKDRNQGLNALISSLAKNTDVTYAGGKYEQDIVIKDGKETKGPRYYVPGKAAAQAVQDALTEKYGRGSKVTLRSIAQDAEAGDVEAYVFLQKIAPYLTFTSGRK
jgi:hypothetical protein